MIRVLFVCHGNICRSHHGGVSFEGPGPAAGALPGNFTIASAATSSEEIGNPVHRGHQEKACGAEHFLFGKAGGAHAARGLPEIRLPYRHGCLESARISWPLSGRIPSTRCTCCWILASIPGTSRIPLVYRGF